MVHGQTAEEILSACDENTVTVSQLAGKMSGAFIEGHGLKSNLAPATQLRVTISHRNGATKNR